MSDYVTKDSGERAQFDSGMQRDTEAGKPRFDLLLAEGVPFEEQMLTRFAALMGRGAEKYDSRNWERADSQAEMDRMKSSAFRHLVQWLCGEDDEDHAAAVMFNIVAHETTGHKVKDAEAEPEGEKILAHDGAVIRQHEKSGNVLSAETIDALNRSFVRRDRRTW